MKYLKNPPAAEELERILNLLGIEPRDLMRTNEAPYKDMNLGDSALSRSELIAAMRQHPILIQRPIVLANGRAAIGRPPEQVLGLL